MIDTYERKSTICAPTDLGLVDVNEYPRMAQWPTSSIAHDRPRLRPSYGLFVYQINGSLGLWLIGQ